MLIRVSAIECTSNRSRNSPLIPVTVNIACKAGRNIQRGIRNIGKKFNRNCSGIVNKCCFDSFLNCLCNGRINCFSVDFNYRRSAGTAAAAFAAAFFAAFFRILSPRCRKSQITGYAGSSFGDSNIFISGKTMPGPSGESVTFLGWCLKSNGQSIKCISCRVPGSTAIQIISNCISINTPLRIQIHVSCHTCNSCSIGIRSAGTIICSVPTCKRIPVTGKCVRTQCTNVSIAVTGLSAHSP